MNSVALMCRAVALSGVAGVLVAGAVFAQQGRSCAVELQSADEVAQRMFATGRIHQFASGNVRARCLGQVTTMRTDSFAHYPEFNRAEFVGTVRFRDESVALDADRATYFVGEERLEAFGDVQLVNRATGSVLTGRRLTYWRVVRGVRDTAELYAVSRPRVEYRVPGDTADPYVIVGNQVRMKGSSSAWVSGNVTIDRDEFAAKGDSAVLDVDAGHGFLYRNAEARSRDTTGYTLRGDAIAFRLTAGELTWVQARSGARATSSDWRIDGETIEFVLADDKIQGGTAWGDSTRAISQSYTVVADSIAVDLPEQTLREVRGFGAARAKSSADSAGLETDWIAGDSLTVRFAATEDGGNALASIQARGNAQAFYRIYDALQPGLPPGINYSRGLVITASFRDDTLERVDVIGEADGIYLAPQTRRP